jgi:hypothetical protein
MLSRVGWAALDSARRTTRPGQYRPGGGSSANDNGDLCVTQLDFAGGQVGHMFLTGFGHGVSIGVEPVGSTSYLWTEVDSPSGTPPTTGQYLYMLDGDAYSDTNPSPGNAHVSSVNLNGGTLTRVQTNAGGTLSYREPEGMAVSGSGDSWFQIGGPARTIVACP